MNLEKNEKSSPRIFEVKQYKWITSALLGTHRSTSKQARVVSTFSTEFPKETNRAVPVKNSAVKHSNLDTGHTWCSAPPNWSIVWLDDELRHVARNLKIGTLVPTIDVQLFNIITGAGSKQDRERRGRCGKLVFFQSLGFYRHFLYPVMKVRSHVYMRVCACTFAFGFSLFCLHCGGTG